MTHTDEPAGDYYVSPRHLAGSTVEGDPGLQPALNAGWKPSWDDDGNVFLPAPDQRVRIGYMPEGDDDALWKISAYQHHFGAPLWAAAFNSMAPTEFVTAFTSQLVAAYQRDDGSDLRDPGGVVRAFGPLLEAGWRVHNAPGRCELTSPDGLAGAWYDRGLLDEARELVTNDTRWGMWGGPERSYSSWYAVFSSRTPVDLITATATAVVNPEPVLRWEGELSQMTKRYAQLTPVVPPKPPAPTPLDLARFRTPPAVRPASVRRWSTSTVPGTRLPAPTRPAARR
ncbi:DUF317 domain-containing protein [Streptomyces sp. NPDC048723]|uniref:DUF317 domain-containing protein n=1 Tax=Streptomyces sp. NPDC048723 TaxID=3365589 RepID=UPI003714A497